MSKELTIILIISISLGAILLVRLLGAWLLRINEIINHQEEMFNFQEDTSKYEEKMLKYQKEIRKTQDNILKFQRKSYKKQVELINIVKSKDVI